MLIFGGASGVHWRLCPLRGDRGREDDVCIGHILCVCVCVVCVCGVCVCVCVCVCEVWRGGGGDLQSCGSDLGTKLLTKVS